MYPTVDARPALSGFFNIFCPVIHINYRKKNNIEDWTFVDSQ